MSGACGDCGQTVVRGEDAEQAVVAAAWSNHRRYCRKPRTLPTGQQLEGCQTCATTHLMVDLHKWSAAAIAKANGMGVPRLKKHLYRHGRADLAERLDKTPDHRPEPKPRERRPEMDSKQEGRRTPAAQLADHTDRRIAAAARKVLEAATQLDRVWERHAAQAALRAKRDRLKAQLADVEAQLRGKPAPAADSAAVRAWAKEHGFDCPASGVVPARVRDAYETAVAS